MTRNRDFLFGLFTGAAAAVVGFFAVERLRRGALEAGTALMGRERAPSAGRCPMCGADRTRAVDGGLLYRHLEPGTSEARTVYWALLECAECRSRWHEEVVEEGSGGSA